MKREKAYIAALASVVELTTAVQAGYGAEGHRIFVRHHVGNVETAIRALKYAEIFTSAARLAGDLPTVARTEVKGHNDKDGWFVLEWGPVK